MIKLKTLFVLLLALVTLECAQFRTSDFALIIQEPASKKCFEIKVMSGAEKEYSPEECEKIKQRAILITSESWKLIKGDIQTNCQFAECRQIEGAGDGLFLSVDRALNKMPY